MDNQNLTAAEAAQFLGCSVSFIRKAKQRGELPYTQLGSRYTFDKNDVLNLVKRVGHEPHNNDTAILE